MAVSPLLPIGNLSVVEDSYVKGGYHTVADNTARDAIPTERRRAGMLVWVEAAAVTYRLESGLTNGDWVSTAGTAYNIVTLTDAATIAVDVSLSTNFQVTLGDNRTLGNPPACAL